MESRSVDCKEETPSASRINHVELSPLAKLFREPVLLLFNKDDIVLIFRIIYFIFKIELFGFKMFGLITIVELFMVIKLIFIYRMIFVSTHLKICRIIYPPGEISRLYSRKSGSFLGQSTSFFQKKIYIYLV